MNTWSAKFIHGSFQQFPALGAEGDVSSYCCITICHSKQCSVIQLKIVCQWNVRICFCLHIAIFCILISLAKYTKLIYRYPSFYEHSIYEFSLQWSTLISTYFALNELHFHYNKQLTFADILAHTNLPPSRSLCTIHDHTESAMSLMLTFYV
jgi:hypothetical protein